MGTDVSVLIEWLDSTAAPQHEEMSWRIEDDSVKLDYAELTQR